jgi:phosphoglycolate phosphatase-like HAD superfamily hydrolase
MDFYQRKNLIFDLDGTLADTSGGIVRSTNFALNAMGEKGRRPDEIKRFIGYPLETMFGRFSRKSFSEFRAHFQEMAREEVVASAVPIGQAGKVLKELWENNFYLGIGSTKIRIHIEKILEKFGWHQYISAFIGADDVVNVKPNPEAFIKTMKLMNANSSNSIVIGDTINDILAARAAEIPTVGIKSIFGGCDKLIKSKPDFMLDRIEDLPGLLRKVNI